MTGMMDPIGSDGHNLSANARHVICRTSRLRRGQPRRPCLRYDTARRSRPARLTPAEPEAEPEDLPLALVERSQHAGERRREQRRGGYLERALGRAILDEIADLGLAIFAHRLRRRVRRELEALAPVELLDRVHQAEVALLDQVEQRQPGCRVLLGDRHDETNVGLHELTLRLPAQASRTAQLTPTRLREVPAAADERRPLVNAELRRGSRSRVHHDRATDGWHVG
jgi:hypothetical protein